MKIFTFLTKEELEEQLAIEIANKLTQELKAKDKATLLVSGGSTPTQLYQKLSRQIIDWSKITIGLVDERYVPNTSDFSNEKLVKHNLIINNAASAKFLPMVVDENNLIGNVDKVASTYALFANPTVVILGMGGDGHTASLFPNDKPSEDNLRSADIKPYVIQTNAPNEPKIRITCSKNLILSAANIYLMIIGQEKLNVLNESKIKQYPIAQFADKSNVYCAKN
jgi:6-phosphogluconolactonase